MIMSHTEEAYEPEGRIYRSTPITLHVGTRENVTEVLGIANGIDPVTGLPRKLWGLADKDRVYLSHMCYAITPLMDPPVILADLRRSGSDRFTFHSGMPLWATVEELTRALTDLGLAAPERYKGVLVPEALINNWGQVEAEWWRKGVEQATAVAGSRLRKAATELTRQAEELYAEGLRG